MMSRFQWGQQVSEVELGKYGSQAGYTCRLGKSREEIRFTQKGNNLYAVALAWPEDGMIVIKSLSESSRLLNGKINEVELLGYGKVDFIRTEKGLEVNLPEAGLNEIAPVLKIRL
ncbi:MAG: hypothetical protein H9777_10625 [Candidatus Phocaeicola faecigallinarum]|uniref:Alpha-L-fucosidase C-terminal domain-containing protein n=1 Tax=Candidatus Phocaeicola faecigallinarum TaxID=2838732 RepID=A0A948TD18_9BACT|nr:hypothetical protein [Candidatus Phocaeicola faecigallinarum]